VWRAIAVIGLIATLSSYQFVSMSEETDGKQEFTREDSEEEIDHSIVSIESPTSDLEEELSISFGI